MIARVLLLVTTLIMCVLPGQSWGATLVVHADAEVSDETIWLSDIATVTGGEDNLELIKRMARIDLGPAPKPGNKRTLSQGTIKTRMKATLGDVDVVVPKTVVVHRKAAVLNQEALSDAIETWALDVLTNDLNMPDASVQILSISRERLLVSPQFTGFDIQGDPSRLPIGSVPLTVLVQGSNGKVERFSLSARLKLEAPVLVLAHTVRRGKEIREKDLKTELRDLSRGAKPLFDASQVIGLKAKRELKEGALLLASDVEFPPDVLRGEPITLLVRSGSLKISVPGEAKSDGRIGEIIPVYCPSTRRSLRGFVLAPGVIEIPFHSTLGR